MLNPTQRKPFDLQVVRAFAAECGCPVSSLCMVGDRLLTDVALAHLCGCISILTCPLVMGPNKAERVVLSIEHRLARWLPTARRTEGVSEELYKAVSIDYLGHKYSVVALYCIS